MIKTALYTALTGMLLSTAASAHHSASDYDIMQRKTITGVVKKFEWTNPHVWIWVEVPNATGGNTLWGIEMASPGSLRNSNFNWKSVKVGEKMSADLVIARDGSPRGIFAGKMTHEDGTVYEGGLPLGRFPGAGAAPSK